VTTARDLLDLSPGAWRQAELVARFEAVLAMHYERQGWCDQCEHEWPCPTRRILDGEKA